MDHARYCSTTKWGVLKTTVGVRHRCLLSPILFNLFLESIMQKTFYDRSTTISIGGREICNLLFADDIGSG